MALEKHEKRVARMFWLDMEMTGLDEKSCVILEIAAVVTDLELQPLDTLHRVIRQPEKLLLEMDEWCKKTHGENGLVAEVPNGIALTDAEQELCALARKHFPDSKLVLCGNSIGQDRRFVDAYLPSFSKLLHYRLIDVSSFKEVYRNRYGVTYPKKESHRARDDIFESIAELKHYLSFVKLPVAPLD